VSRDPIEEEGGANLLAYLQGDPANGVDVLGLAGMDSVTSSLWAAAVRGDVATIQFLIQQGCLSSTTLALANRLLPMANRINHIFNNPAHNMASLVTAYGNDMMAALNGIQQAAAAAVTGANGSIFTQVVQVQGFSVTVTGRVIDGVAVVSNAWIP
jgi:hypothetical protein